MTDRRARVTQAPKRTAKVGDGAALAECSLFINCERLRDSQPQLFPHVVTGPDGPAAPQECETPTDKHNDHKAHRV